jgi:hypothetical protein
LLFKRSQGCPLSLTIDCCLNDMAKLKSSHLFDSYRRTPPP